MVLHTGARVYLHRTVSWNRAIVYIDIYTHPWTESSEIPRLYYFALQLLLVITADDSF